MHLLTRVADWMQAPDPAVHAVLADATSAQAETLAVLVVAAAQLEQQRGLEAPATSFSVRLEMDVQGLPPQTAHVDPTSPFGRWLNLATLAEHLEAARLAQLMTDCLRERVMEALNGESADTPQLKEWSSICWTRRGRLARVAGALDDAGRCYMEALTHVPPGWWKDARPMAALGLCMVAASRGNYPAVIRRASDVLAARPFVHPLHRVPAHQIRALALRKQRRYIDALLDAWSAYDLLNTDDLRRAETILSMSEIAADTGDLTAASHGFSRVAHAKVPRRIEVSARIGLLATSVRAMRAHAVDEVAMVGDAFTALRRLLSSPLPPRDELRVLAALLDAGFDLQAPMDELRAWLAQAEYLARAHGYFEQQFQLESVSARLRARHSLAPAVRASTGVTEPPSPPSVTAGKSRHPALDRLLQIA